MSGIISLGQQLLNYKAPLVSNTNWYTDGLKIHFAEYHRARCSLEQSGTCLLDHCPVHQKLGRLSIVRFFLVWVSYLAFWRSKPVGQFIPASTVTLLVIKYLLNLSIPNLFRVRHLLIWHVECLLKPDFRLFEVVIKSAISLKAFYFWQVFYYTSLNIHFWKAQ